MEKDLMNIVETQKEQIKELHGNVKDLERRLSAAERVVVHVKGHLEKIEKLTSRIYWLVILILAGVVLLLGSN